MSDSPEEDLCYALNETISILPAVSAYSKISADFGYAYAKLKLNKDYSFMDALPYLKLIRSLDKESVAISVGGDIYCYEDYRKYIRIHQEIAKRHKTVLLGCSLEKKLFSDPEFHQDMRSYDYVSARESLTYSYLKEAGIANIGLAPDSAFVLPTIELPLPEGFLEGNTVGINVSPLVERKENKPNIVKENYRHLIDYILKNTDCSIALIPHVVWKDNDDRTILREFYEEYKDTGRVVMIEDHNCMELKGYIARCRFFIGARTHATIAAYSSCVPTLAVGYSIKSKGIAIDLFGTDENYVIPVRLFNEVGDLTKSFCWVMEREEEIRDCLNNIMPKHVTKAKQVMNTIKMKLELK